MASQTSLYNRLLARVRRIDPFLLLVLLLSLPALAPLFAPGFFYESHDGRHSVFYQVMFDASLRNGALAPRWAMHHLQGYGYPTFVILAPLGFYITELFVLLGAGFTTAVRCAFALSILGSGVGFYVLMRHLLSVQYSVFSIQPAPERARTSTEYRILNTENFVALAAALIYVYAPYRMLDIYVRGALNESLLFLWLPWLFLAFDRLLVRGLERGWQGRLVLATLLLAATWLTHSFAIFCITPLLAAYILFRAGQLGYWARPAWWHALWRRVALGAAAGICALLLIAFFLLPLLAENRYLDQQVYTTDTYDFRNHFVQVGQFLDPFWGYGYSDDAAGANDGMGFQVGIIGAVVGLAALCIVGRARHKGLILFYMAATGLLLLSMTPLAAPLWEAAPLISVIQFPWRLLLLATFTLSMLAGLTLAELIPLVANGANRAVSSLRTGEGAGMLLIGALAVVATAAYADPALQPVEPWREDGRAVYRFEEQFPDMITGTEWTQEYFTESPMSADYADPAYSEEHGRTGDLTRLSIVDGSGLVTEQRSAGTQFGGNVRMETPGTVRVNLLYFPGWQATLDGAPVAFQPAPPYGLIDIAVPAGDHTLEVRMAATPDRMVGMAVSWVTLLALVGLALWGWLQSRKSVVD